MSAPQTALFDHKFLFNLDSITNNLENWVASCAALPCGNVNNNTSTTRLQVYLEQSLKLYLSFFLL